MGKRSPPTAAAADAERSAPSRSATAGGDHWKRLLRPAPEPRALGLNDFLAELNRRLQADACYRPGTRFVATSGAEGRPVGTTWEGPPAMRPVVSRIVGSVACEFDGGLPFYSDP